MFKRLLAVVLWLLLPPSATPAGSVYLVRDLTPDIGQYAQVNAISCCGTLAGISAGEAFTWNPQAGYTRLAVPDGATRCGANSLNSSGIAAGWAQDGYGYGHAVVWNADGSYRLLQNPTGAKSAVARSINSSGHVVGVAIFEETASLGAPPAIGYHLAIWDPDGSVQDLGLLSILHTVDTILDDGRIYGRIAGPRIFWIRNTDGVTTETHADVEDYSEYNNISASGLIAGCFQTAPDAPCNAAIWNTDGTLHSILPPLSSTDDLCDAYDINSGGFAVGESSIRGGYPSIDACLWMPDGTPVALPTIAGTVYSRAQLINAAGWIVGECGMDIGSRTVLWTPVSEPSGFVVIALGIAALRGLRKHTI